MAPKKNTTLGERICVIKARLSNDVCVCVRVHGTIEYHSLIMYMLCMCVHSFADKARKFLNQTKAYDYAHNRKRSPIIKNFLIGDFNKRKRRVRMHGCEQACVCIRACMHECAYILCS